MKQVREVMNPVLLSIAPERRVIEAARAMAERRVHHLLVMRRGELMGIVCSCDTKVPDRKRPVAEVMSKRLLTVAAAGTVDDAVEVMLGQHVGFLPVVESDGAVVGVVTRGDLARALGKDRSSDLGLACKWCASHRHVAFRPMQAGPVCDDCLADDDWGYGEGD